MSTIADLDDAYDAFLTKRIIPTYTCLVQRIVATRGPTPLITDIGTHLVACSGEIREWVDEAYAHAKWAPTIPFAQIRRGYSLLRATSHLARNVSAPSKHVAMSIQHELEEMTMIPLAALAPMLLKYLPRTIAGIVAGYSHHTLTPIIVNISLSPSSIVIAARPFVMRYSIPYATSVPEEREYICEAHVWINIHAFVNNGFIPSVIRYTNSSSAKFDPTEDVNEWASLAQGCYQVGNDNIYDLGKLAPIG